ncbi:hypothetical protein GGH13_005591 [Coemansia sp. S155-1]|nr:hypothetical protein GGH13_005591 [Coemansia sp. S155-1]
MEEISRLVDEYVGKYPVIEIVAKITVHLHYQDKLDSVNYTDLALRIAHGQTTVGLVAKELDVPHSALTNRLQAVNRKQYSPIWTDEEIHKLVDYMQTCNSKPDYGYFSNFLGTKSPRLCYSKTAFLRSKGVLPPISKSLGL